MLVWTEARLWNAALLVWFAFFLPFHFLELSLPLNPKETQSILCCLLNLQDYYSQPIASSVLPGKLTDNLGTWSNKPVLCYNQVFWTIYRSVTGHNMDICVPLRRYCLCPSCKQMLTCFVFLENFKVHALWCVIVLENQNGQHS